jgi:hypothetical protein
MGHLNIYWKRNKNHHKIIQKHKYTNIFQKHKQDKKHTVATCNESGIYQLKCNNCPLKYVGETEIF